MVTSSKIRKLNRDIAKIELQIDELNEKIPEYKKKMDKGSITKAQFQKVKMNIAIKVRGLNAAIHRKKKARHMIEKDMKEKEKEEDEEAL